MSRYIDADFEIAHYTSMTTNPTPDVTEKDKRNSLVILDALRMAKTIDIVRCKECKYYESKEDWCYWRDEAITADDFCSYGVRETNTTAEEKPTPIRDYMVHGEREGE